MSLFLQQYIDFIWLECQVHCVRGELVFQDIPSQVWTNGSGRLAFTYQVLGQSGVS